jgi:circadian clock protein KaiC
MTAASLRVKTGIAGLDDILAGGLIANRLYLVEGMPGSGKTTLAFQFLLEGARLGEPVLYVALSETEEEIRGIAASHGWFLEGIAIRELLPPDHSLAPDEQYTVFHPAEVELSGMTEKILQHVEQVRPTRVVFDSLSELRLLAGNPLHYRRQILALKQYFTGRRCTTLLLDDLTALPTRDLQVQSLVHGALMLEHTLPGLGAPRRRLSVSKYRGSDFRGGQHDYRIHRGGLTVYPRLVAAEHRQTSATGGRLRSGLAGLDALLGGGLARGTSTLIQGAPGTGKSSLAALFAARTAECGEHATLFVFDESIHTLLSRMEGLHVEFKKHIDAGRIHVRPVDPAELSPGEFADEIRRAVDDGHSSMVVIDSLNGYLNSMPEERYLIVQLHELLSYLGQHGVATVMVSAQQGLIGAQMRAPVDASYLADAVILLRYYEAQGEVREAISVVKMRGGQHERTLREFNMRDGRITVGESLRGYRGVLSGIPEREAAS